MYPERTETIVLSHIDCIPVWVDDNIQLIDMYLKNGKWIGSRRTFRYCEEENKYYASKA